MTPEPSTIMINDQLSSSSNASSATASPSTPLSSTTVTTATASMNDNNNNNNHSNNHEPWISTISTSMANYHPQQQLSNHLRSQLTNNSGYSSSSPPRQPPPSTLSLMNKSLNDQEKGFNKDNSPATSSMTEMLQQALTISTICNYRQRFERLLLLIIFIVCTLCIILLVLMIVILINQRYLNEKTINNDNNNQNNEQNYWKQLQSSLSSYPHPQLLPGYYHYYYSINNGINHPLNVPLLMANNDQNQSSSSSSLSESNTNNDNHTIIEQPKQSPMNQNPLKFYQNFIPTPPMGPIFSALQLLSARNSNNNANDDYYKRIAAMINKQPEQLKSTFISPDYTNQDSRTVCLSSGCVKAASDILNLIDETIDPCDDFYRFACGGWIHRTTIPDEAGHISIFEQSRERLDIQLKDLLERTNELTSTPPIRTMKNMYRSCMNLTAIEKIGTKSLRNSLNELGGWPVVVGDQWNENEFDWINVTGKIRRIGYKPEMFVTFKVIADVMNNTRNMIFIDEATLGLRRQLITQGSNHTTVRVYHQLMVDTAILFGAQNRTRVEQEMWDVIAFESQIAHATHDPSQGEKKQSWYLYLKAFADVANQSEVLATNQSRLGHDWIRFINAAIELPDDEKFNEKELVMVDNIRYMGQIDYLISFVNKHDKRLLANYMLWRVVLQNLGTGSKVMRDMRDNLNKHLYGITEKMARWKLCLSQLTGSLAIALSSHYIRYNFNETSKEKAKEMVKFIQQEFEDILHHTDWMDNETKINAFKKSSAMKAIVGYPHELANETLVEEHYKDLHLTPDNFELNIRRVRIWAHRNEFKKLRKRNDPHNWKYFGNAANVNAFYWSQANSIVIPAGILRDIFYDHDRPQYLNFGTIGYVIGHEITHGFDNIGAQFDEIGNARNWWRNDTKKHYHEKAQCMVKQYREYPLKVNKLQINGELTLKENIADNGAIKEAYQAYERYVKKFGEELLLPGLRYTPRQLFWIAAAMNWCSKSSPEMFKTRLDTDSHSPSEARVNVAFSNYQPFADTFGCRLGTKSNALHKCSVW